MLVNSKPIYDKRSCVILHPNAVFFACGSMVLAYLLCAVFPRYARKTAHT